MRDRDGRLSIPNDILTVVICTCALVFLLTFGGKALEAYRLQRHNAMLREEIAALEREKEELQERLQYVHKPEYVEKVAREEFKWVRPGEILVVPVLRDRQGSTIPVATPGAADKAEHEMATSYWEEWWRLVLGPLD
jgi:cell division protein FtsB